MTLLLILAILLFGGTLFAVDPPSIPRIGKREDWEMNEYWKDDYWENDYFDDNL